MSCQQSTTFGNGIVFSPSSSATTIPHQPPHKMSTSFATSSLLLLILLQITTTTTTTTTTAFGSSTLQSLVHHWLHWGANHHHPNQPSPAFHPRASPQPLQNLPSYITGALNANHSQPLYSLTMMHRPEIDLLASYLTDHHVYLEFGAGGSTLTFTPLVKRAYSLEHNCDWVRFINRLIATFPASRYTNLHIKCVSMKPRQNGWGTLSNYEHANYKQFRQYVDAVDTIPETTIDRVFIDGRARLACALKLLPKLHNESLIFIHDFYSRTSHYKPVLIYYTEVARILATQNTDPTQGPVDEPQGLIVLRRKNHIDYNLSPDDIDAIYESIDWRFPFAQPLTSLPAFIRYYLTTATDPGLWARARNTDDVLRLVHRDVFRLSILYIVVTMLLSIRHVFKQRSNGARMTDNTKRQQSSENAQTTDPRFVETDAMRAANARRKRASSGGRPV